MKPPGRWPILSMMILAACQISPDPSLRQQLGAHGSRSLPLAWGLPKIEPCSLLSPDELAALAGLMVREARPGGTAIDGSACAYVAEEPFVVTLGILSTAAFESLKPDFGGEPVPGVGVHAFAQGPDALGDVVLYARSRESAVRVLISGVRHRDDGIARRRLAAEVARQALDRIDDAPW